jgi:hypothetical protein
MRHDVIDEEYEGSLLFLVGEAVVGPEAELCDA